MADTANQFFLFKSGEAPFRGQRSAMDPASLREGEAVQAVNFRFDGNKITGRYGMLIDRPAPVAGGVHLGSHKSSIGEWVAVAVSGATRVYQWNAFTSAWVEITDATTRFVSTTQLVTFEIVTLSVFPDVAGFSDVNSNYVIFQNGTEVPRIRNTASDFVAYSTHLHNKFQPPYNSASKCQYRPLNYFNTQAIASRANSGGGVSSATAAYSGGGSIEQFTFATTTTSGDNARITMPAIALSSTPSQLHFIFKSTDAFLLQKLRIIVQTAASGTPASTEYVLYDPATNPQALTIVPIDDVYSQAVISIETVYTTGLSVVSAGLPATSYSVFKLQYQSSAAVTASQTLELYYLGFGAAVQYGGQVACAYWGSGSRAESPGVVCEIVRSPYIAEIGGTPIKNLRIAESPLCYYRLTVWSTKREGLPTDATHIVWFLKAYQALDFKQIAANPTSLASYSSREWVTRNIETDAVIERVAPDALYESVPIGSCMATTGHRLVVGNARFHDGSSVAKGDGSVAFSANAYPLRFRRAVEFTTEGIAVSESPIVLQVASVPVIGLKTFSSGNLGSDPVIVFSAENVQSVDGSDASQFIRPYVISPEGTRSPWSIAASDQAIFYLDTNRQVRAIYGAYSKPITIEGVDDKLAGIPDERISHVTAAVHNERLYLAFTPFESTSNEQLLIYDLRINGWYTDSTSSNLRWARLLGLEQGTKKKLFFSNEDGACYEHENNAATTDNGQAITCRLQFRELNFGWDSKITVESVGVLADVVPNGEITTRRKYRTLLAASPTGTLPLSDSSGEKRQVLRWDRKPSLPEQVAGSADYGISVEIETSNFAGNSIYGVFTKLRRSPIGPDRA